MVTQNQIFSLLKKQYGIKNPKLSDLDGHTDKVFLVAAADKKFVLKISMNHKMRDAIFQQQLNFIDFLKQRGFNIPNFIKAKNGNDFAQICDYRKRNCILFEYVEGISYEIKNDKEFGDFCNWFIAIHKNCLEYHENINAYLNSIILETKKNNYIKNYARQYKKRHMRPLLDIQKRILSKYQKCSGNLRTAMLVNDLNETNIKIRDGQKVILDFNLAGKNYMVDELSWVLVWYFIQKDKIDKVGDFLKLYLKTNFLNKTEISLLKELPILFQSRLQFKNVEDIRDKNIFSSKMEQLIATTKDFQKQTDQIS